jgi:nitric oxide reductase large subunit
MRYVFGMALIIAGIAQIAFRNRTARASAASNNVMLNGHLNGPGWIRYNTTMAAIVGGIFVVAGILAMAGVFGPVH